MKSFRNFNKSFVFLCMLLFTFAWSSLIASESVKIKQTGTVIHHKNHMTSEQAVQAPLSTLYNIQGTPKTFPVLGKWNLLVYWSLFCQSCIEEMPMIQEGLKEFENDNLTAYFISIDTVRMQKALVNFVRRRDFNHEILLEEVTPYGYLTAGQWNVTMTPTFFLVSPSGEIAFRHEGPINILELFETIRYSLKGGAQ